MATLIIPLEDAADLGNFSITVDLDGVDYQFDFAYNGREDAWYFDLLDVVGNYLRSGVKVVANWPLLWRYVSEDRPAGEIVSLDTRDTPLDPALADLGLNVLFGYEQEESVP